MQPGDQSARTGPVPAGEPEAAAMARDGFLTPRGKGPRDHAWLWALTAGLVAGLASWIGGEAAYRFFQPVIQLPANWSKLSPYEKTDVLAELTLKATPSAEMKNTATAYGLLGASLAGTLGLVGGTVRRSQLAALSAALIGAVTGAAAGTAVSMVLTRVFYQYLEPESGLTLALLVHGGIWVSIGLAVGLAFGIGIGGMGSIVRASLGGMAGAALGTMLFECVNAVMFPLVRVLEPVPAESLPRLLAFLSVAIFVPLGAALGVRERSRRVTLSTGPA
jgi:MFS family permease